MRHGESEQGQADLHPNDHVDRMQPHGGAPVQSPAGSTTLPAPSGTDTAPPGTDTASSRTATASSRTATASIGAQTSSIGADTVVVGVDESAASRSALRWALAHSAGTGGRVVAVTAWHSPVQTSPRGAQTRTETQEQTRARTEAAVRQEAAVRDRAADVPVLVGHGRPAEVLADRSRGAGLLVVGNDRPGWLSTPASTVLDCLRLASVPVVVVPREPTP